MKRSSYWFLFLTLGLVCSSFILAACSAPQEVPTGEQKYTEGTMVQGGRNSFRMKADDGRILRFVDRKDIEYQPADFHTYYGDRLGVTYVSEIKSGEERHMALRIVLLQTAPDRIDFQSGSAEGIVQASGMMRYLVYLPKKELTVAFYKSGSVKREPSSWYPEAGNKVMVNFTEQVGMFVKTFKASQITRVGEDLVGIPKKSETGTVTEIFVHRSVKKAPDRFAFRTDNGEIYTIFAGGETVLVPDDLKVESGQRYKITYYRLLMGDQSLRYVARQIE